MLIHFSQVILMQPQKKHIKKSRDSVGTRYIVNYCISLNTFTHTHYIVIDSHFKKIFYRTYEDMEREVSQIFGFRWYALNDKQYKRTPLNLNIPFYYEGFDEADQ